MRWRLFPLLFLLGTGACFCGNFGGGGGGSNASCDGLAPDLIVAESPRAGQTQCLLLNPVRGSQSRIALDHNAGPEPITSAFAAGSRFSVFLESMDIQDGLVLKSEDDSVLQVVGERQLLFVNQGTAVLNIEDADGFIAESFVLDGRAPDWITLQTPDEGREIHTEARVDVDQLPVLDLLLQLDGGASLNHRHAVQVEVLQTTDGIAAFEAQPITTCEGVDAQNFQVSDACPPCKTQLSLSGTGHGLARLSLRALGNPEVQRLLEVSVGAGGSWEDPPSEDGPIVEDAGIPSMDRADSGQWPSDGGSAFNTDGG
jgi:hypothetical protein